MQGMLVTEMTATQLYCLLMLAFVVVMMAGQGLKMLPSLDGRQKIVAYAGLFVAVIGPAIWGALTLQG